MVRKELIGKTDHLSLSNKAALNVKMIASFWKLANFELKDKKQNELFNHFNTQEIKKE